MKYLTRYSKALEVFNPVNIQMLVDLSSLDKNILEYDEEENDIKAGDVCQMDATPSALMIGYFNAQGNGRCYFIIKDDTIFEEDVHFKFI